MNNPVETVIFPCERALVLNAIYDVLDALGLATEHVNSERGVLAVRTPEGAELRIMVDTVFPSKRTQVGITIAQGDPSDWIRIVFDELESMLAAARRGAPNLVLQRKL